MPYTSLAVVYAPLPNKASGAVHFIGRRPYYKIKKLTKTFAVQEERDAIEMGDEYPIKLHNNKAV